MANPNEYFVFEPDQVLTNDHLNETFNYLDQQNRWTRNKLIGIGIACGLDIVIHPGVIKITKGVGVTSQGYLILLDTTLYTHYIPYAPIDQPEDLPFTYPGDLPFYKPFCTGKSIYLLLSEEEFEAMETSDQTLAQTISSVPLKVMADYVVVLFLEANEKDLKNCDAFDCNNKGEKMTMIVRSLLVKKSDLPSLRTARKDPASFWEVAKSKGPEVHLKRYNVPYTPLLNTDDVLNAFVKLVDDATLSEVAKAYTHSYVVYSQFIPQSGNPFANLFNVLKKHREVILLQNPLFIEYFYDFIDDLIKAYYEFRTKSNGLITTCCPDENLFPLHLVLGEASHSTNALTHDPFRNYFLYSPLFAKQGSEITEIGFLFVRMELMVKEFTENIQLAVRESPIKITPSQYESFWLSQRAIPYYYRVNVAGFELYKAWNYEKSIQGNAALNLGYNANEYAASNAVLHPLLYDIEQFNFFRIEGHIGHNYRSVLNNILSQRQLYNLPFDVVAVSAEQLRLSLQGKLPECNILDLETDYNLLVTEYSCKLHNPFCLVSKFPYVQTQDIANSLKDKSSFEAFKINQVEAQNLGAAIYTLKLGYRKGDFMRKFCPPAANTVGSYYLNHLSSTGVFTNPVQSNSQNFNSLLYAAIFNFIDRAEDIMLTLMTSTVASLDVDLAKKLYLNCLAGGMQLGLYLMELTESLNQDKDPAKEWLEDLQLQLLAESFTMIGYTCLDDRLQTLKEEYFLRLKAYELQLNFLTYYKKHPGLEHKAGVPKGGTFVLVYHTANRPSLSSFSTVDLAVIAAEQPKAAAPTAYFDPVNLELLRSFVDDCNDAPTEKKNAILEILYQVPGKRPKFTIADGAVIADFYIPYLCCSDCPPIAYVLPRDPQPDPTTEKPVIQMATSFCDNDTNPSPISVSIPNGSFADAQGNKIPGLDEGGLSFTPEKAGDGTFSIIYTVAGVASDPTVVTVSPAPKGSKFSIKPEGVQDDRTIKVTFVPEENSEQLSYTWKFGDGFTPQTSNDEFPVVIAKIADSGGTITTFATLQISNGTCAAPEFKQELNITPNGVFTP
jgi:hypothetical protein